MIAYFFYSIIYCFRVYNMSSTHFHSIYFYKNFVANTFIVLTLFLSTLTPNIRSFNFSLWLHHNSHSLSLCFLLYFLFPFSLYFYSCFSLCFLFLFLHFLIPLFILLSFSTLSPFFLYFVCPFISLLLLFLYVHFIFSLYILSLISHYFVIPLFLSVFLLFLLFSLFTLSPSPNFLTLFSLLSLFKILFHCLLFVTMQSHYAFSLLFTPLSQLSNSTFSYSIHSLLSL